MDLIKKMLKYLLILAIIAVLACSLIAGILFIFPSLSLFGLRYAANHKQNIAEEVNSVITKVNIETNHYNIVIKPNSEKNEENPDNTTLRVVINNDFTGYSKNGITNANIKKSVSENYLDAGKFDSVSLASFKVDGELTLALTEPEGLIAYGSSSVIVFLPENATGVEYNLKTNTGKISFEKNNFDESKTISTKNITLSVSSYKGSFNLDNADMQDGSDLTISNYIGRVEVNSERIGNVKINSNSGNFTFKQIGYEGFNGGDLTVEGNNPYIRVKGTVFGSVKYTNVVTGFVEIDTIKKDLIYESKNGILRVNKTLGNVKTTNETGETTIKQIGSESSERTSVDIKSISGVINLGTEETKIYFLANVTTETGRVNIKNLVENNAVITTTKGSVDVSFTPNLKQNLTVTTVSGQVSLDNVSGKMDIKTENSSKIYAKFLSFNADSNFQTDGGEVELVLPAPTESEDKRYELNLSNRQKNKLNISIGAYSKTEFDGEKDEDLYYNFVKSFPENMSGYKIFVKTNSGLIKVHE